MVRLWKIMFDLVLTMWEGVLLRLWGAVKNNRLYKKTQKVDFLKIQKFIRADNKSYCCQVTFASLDKLLSCLKVHFLVFWRRILPFLCLSVRHTLFTPFNGLPKVQCPNFFDIWNPWGKSNIKKWSQIWTFWFKNGVKLPQQKKFFTIFFFFICSLRLTVFLSPLPKVQCPTFLDI